MVLPPLQPTLSRAASRELDRLATVEFGIPSCLLMENAGRAASDILMSVVPTPRRVVVCCGKGNNGGDGLVLARHLERRGVPVEVLAFVDPATWTGDTKLNHGIVTAAKIPCRNCVLPWGDAPEILTSADWIVDGLLGTGAIGDPRGAIATAIQLMNGSGRPIFALDLPSGLDADTGAAGDPTIRATITCTMVAAKRGFLAPGASAYVGEVQVVDIGAPRILIERTLAGEAD